MDDGSYFQPEEEDQNLVSKENERNETLAQHIKEVEFGAGATNMDPLEATNNLGLFIESSIIG